MIFPVIRYHVKHGCESFKNQEDLDWAMAHGWADFIPDDYDRIGLEFEPSRIPASMVMERLKREAEIEPEPTEPEEKIIEPPEVTEKPKGKYLSQMNLTELHNECINRGIAPADMTKAQLRKAIGAYDNSHNTNK